MTINAMRFLDRQLGRLLCTCLAPIAVLRNPSPTSHQAKPRRVLVIKLSEMGSTVFAIPALRRLRELAPEAEVFMLVFACNTPIVHTLQLVPPTNLLQIDISSLSSFLISSFRALNTIRRLQIDATIDMDLFLRISAILAFLSGAHTRVGFHRFADEGLDRGGLLTHRVVHSTEYHTAGAFLALVEALVADDPSKVLHKGVLPSDFQLPTYAPSPDASAKVAGQLRSLGLSLAEPGSRLVVVAPDSAPALPIRKWPLESYIDLCRRLLTVSPHTAIAVAAPQTGAPDAPRLVESVADSRCVSMAGKTDFEELLALFHAADVLVTNDGGAAHFASLCSLPSVVLFGPETPRLYGPLGGKAHCLYAHFACSPCLRARNDKTSMCRRSICMEAITVDEVLQEILGILAIDTA